MHREIADSDDEDIIVLRPTNSSRSGSQQFPTKRDSQMSQTDPLDYIDFEDFGPTQSFSSFERQHEQTTHVASSSIPIDSSTTRFLNAVNQIDGSTDSPNCTDITMNGASKASNKRSRANSLKSSGAGPQRKKVKTYGTESSSRPSPASKAQQDFQALMNSGQVDGTGESDELDDRNIASSTDLVSIDPRTQYTSQLQPDSSLGAENVGGEMSDHTTHASLPASYMPPPRTAFGASFSGMVASTSSMGSHQSLIIEGAALDGNPFGQVTQQSNCEEIEKEEEEASGIFTMINHDEEQNSRVLPPEDLEPISDQAFQGSPSYSAITNEEEQSRHPSRVAEVDCDTIEISEEPTKPKQKRGRKSKATKAVDGVDELQLNDLPRAHRAHTVDSVMSEASHATTTSKKSKAGRKRKKTESVPPEATSKNLPSSDLGLDNKAIIGLSPERYVPRPSKRRGQIDPESDLGLSASTKDESFVAAEVRAKGKKARKGRKKQAKSEVTVFEDEFDTSRLSEVDHKTSEQNPESNKPEELPSNVDAEVAEEVIPTKKSKSNVLVHVPVLPQSETVDEAEPVPEPKKRGRKKTKRADTAELEITVNHEKDEEQAVEKSLDQPVAVEEVVEEVVMEIEPDDEKENIVAPEHSKKLETRPAKAVMTPVKQEPSPAKPLSSTSLYNKNTRIGLSKRHSIPSLLRKVNRDKEAPKAIEKKEKLNKRQLEEKEQERIAREEADAEGREYVPLDIMRGKDGMLVEWDF